MAHRFAQIMQQLPKRLVAGAIIGLALALPATAFASEPVKLTGSAGIANTSAGDTSFHSSVNAKAGQKVQIDISYKNTSKSGKATKDLHALFTVPSTPSGTQKITVHVEAANSNLVTSSVTAHFDTAHDHIVFDPGSASVFIGGKHHKLPNSIVNGSNGAAVGDIAAGQSAYIIIGGTVRGTSAPKRQQKPGVQVSNQSERASQNNQWSASNAAQPGDTLKYRLSYKNSGNTTENDVIAQENLPAGLSLVPNTTVVATGNTSTHTPNKSNGITTNGIDLGNFKPGATATVEFEAKVAASSKLACGNNTLNVIGSVQANGLKAAKSTAVTKVDNNCTTPTPPSSGSPICTVFTLTPGANNTVKVTNFQTTVPTGGSFTDLDITWGDGTSMTTAQPLNQTHTYPNSDQRTISAVANFMVGDKTVQAHCPTQTITFPTSPAGSSTGGSTNPSTPAQVASTAASQLVNTGAGNVIGLFFGATILGFVGYRLLLKFMLARR